MAEIRWERYPRAAELDAARAWLVLQRNLGLAANTIDAYGRALEEYLAFSAAKEVPVIAAARDHVAAYVRDLTSRPNPRGANVVVLDSGVGLANATLQQRITAIRLFYDYLMEVLKRDRLCRFRNLFLTIGASSASPQVVSSFLHERFFHGRSRVYS